MGKNQMPKDLDEKPQEEMTEEQEEELKEQEIMLFGTLAIVIEVEVNKYLRACYMGRRVGFGQYKTARESFLAGLLTGMNLTGMIKLVDEEEGGEQDEEAIKGIVKKVLKKKALDVISGEFKPVDDLIDPEDSIKYLKEQG